MTNNKLNYSVSLLLVAVALLAYQSVRFEIIRTKCNATVFANKELTETPVYFFVHFDDDTVSKDDIKALEVSLDKTNAEVNRLRSILGCYFDR